MVGASIARRTRSGTFVGPGICRKWRPLRCQLTGTRRRMRGAPGTPRRGRTRLAIACARRPGPERAARAPRSSPRRCARAARRRPRRRLLPPPVRQRREHVRARAAASSPSRATPTTSPRRSPSPRASACRSSRAAPARAWRARRSARGVVLDTSRHMDAIRDLDPEARRVRVGPGVVQEDLNRAAHRHGLGFGPDTSTANRATIGGMIGNNSSGSHSIVYGTTIDHVHALEVVLSDGSRARCAPVDEAEWARRARADTLEGAIHRGLPEILRDHRDAIAGDYPHHWRQSGGYRLDRLAARRRSTSRASWSARRARSWRSPRPPSGSSRCRRRRCSPSATSTRSPPRSPPPTTRSSSTPRRSS